MYLPLAFAETDFDSIHTLIREYPFATLVTVVDGQPYCNLLPLVATATESSPLEGMASLRLIGHMARANPQWRHFETQTVTVLFTGPNAYIPAAWYPEGVVPTWNYVAVQIRGLARITDSSGLDRILDLSLRSFDAEPDAQWREGLSEEEKVMKDKSIVGFEIEILECEAKFKLSQNRSLEDAQGVIQGLSREPVRNAELLKWMHRALEQRLKP